MSKWRKAPKIDANQPEIVKALIDHGCTVEPKHDDILVGFEGRTLWVELKTLDTFKKSGGIKAGTFKPSQVRLMKEWEGDYMIAWTAEQILNELGIKS